MQTEMPGQRRSCHADRNGRLTARTSGRHVPGRLGARGPIGVMNEIACRHRPGADGEATKEAVAAALARGAIADVADLAVDAPCSGTVVLSGAVHSRSRHDLAIATAWSVTHVEAIDDCIR